MQRKYADSPLQFAYIGRWCGFFMSLRGVALDFVVSDGLFYSEEFGALVRSWGDYSPEEIETIQADLAKCIGMNEHRDEMKQ